MTHHSAEPLALQRYYLTETAEPSSSLVFSLPGAKAGILHGSSVLNTELQRLDPPFPIPFSSPRLPPRRGSAGDAAGTVLRHLISEHSPCPAGAELSPSSWLGHWPSVLIPEMFLPPGR